MSEDADNRSAAMLEICLIASTFGSMIQFTAGTNMDFESIRVLRIKALSKLLAMVIWVNEDSEDVSKGILDNEYVDEAAALAAAAATGYLKEVERGR